MGLAGGVTGAGDAAGEVDGDDVPAFVQQRLPDREEIADRGLRGRGQLGIAAQAVVEGLEVVHLQLAFGLALPADVEADLVDFLTVREGLRQVLGAVGGDCDGGHAPGPYCNAFPGLSVPTAMPQRARPTRTSRRRCRTRRRARHSRTAAGSSAS